MELFALPGAGKTTVAQAAAKRSFVSTRNDLSVAWADCSILQRGIHIARALGSPSRLAAALRFGASARIATIESIVRLMRLTAKSSWLKSRSGVMLLDQGFLQDLWSILVSGNSVRADPAFLSPLIRVLYEGVDARIVTIEVEPRLAASRLGERSYGDSRFDGLPTAELHTSLSSALELQSKIIGAAKLAGLPVHTIDGSESPARVADELLSIIPDRTPR